MTKKTLMLSAAIIAVVTAATTVDAGVQARIAGTVVDSAGNPIPTAVVTITSTAVTTYKKVIKVNKDGVFKAVILDATKVYEALVEAEGYQPNQLRIDVPIGSSDTVFEVKLKSLQEAAAEGGASLLQQPGYKEFEEAKALLKAGDAEGARAKLVEAVAAKPDLLPALEGLADLTLESGDMAAALAAAENCLAEDENSLTCLAVATNASAALGDEEGRAAYMARYQVINPEDPTILYNKEAVFLNNLDDEGARPFLEECLEADPDFPQCNFEYGMLLFRSGDMEGAKEHLEKYIEIAPDGPDVATAQEMIKYL
jgi:tetratricopeptide (TPR) repeat protein